MAMTGISRGSDPRHDAAMRAIAEAEEDQQKRAIELLGGAKLLARAALADPATSVDVRHLLVGSVPYATLGHLLGKFRTVAAEDLAQIVGVGRRMLQRRAGKASDPMPAELGSKAWRLAETLAKAEDVLGGQLEAERWLAEPALGLDGERPIYLLRTEQGAQLVGDLLDRMKFGVYN